MAASSCHSGRGRGKKAHSLSESAFRPPSFHPSAEQQWSVGIHYVGSNLPSLLQWKCAFAGHFAQKDQRTHEMTSEIDMECQLK